MSDPVPPKTIFFDLGDTLIYSDSGVDRLYDDTLDVLQMLQQRGYRLGLISNQSVGTSVAQIVSRLSDLHLNTYIESALVTISTEIAGNVGKPAQPIFNLALQKAGHAAASSSSIFITETASHITAARGYGWRAILKRNAGVCAVSDGECVTSLTQLLDLLPALATSADSNLDLAPPPKLVDGLWAVPVDIQRITATLTFDAATNLSTGSALVEFRLGRNGGNPIFDLRQTITGLVLDGDVMAVDEAAHHDFGGGVNAQLRVLERSLEAGTAHQLRVEYSVGPPDAPAAGSSVPQISWAAGGRLTFVFGFSDMGPGRYLESWVPSNLIFDQFELHLTLQIVNSPVTHALIANGSVTPIGTNHWQVALPATSSAFSPLVEVRPADSVTSLSESVTLPISATPVTVEVWKAATDPVVLADQITAIKDYLIGNENTVGRYAHGGRFVAFIRQSTGGMEYDGATSSGKGVLDHETYHSWWGRGVKPAGQPDGWIDEGVTTYFVDDGPSSLPFDFTATPVQLCPRNPWVRQTAGNSYTNGSRFFKGIAAATSIATLTSLMAEFYAKCDGRPVTTCALVEFLLSRVGDPLIVDAFHRFIYGFPDISPIPDAWLRDDFDHDGSESWAGGSFWNSPDLWVRNADDGFTAHQDPVAGRDNWLYARVRNASASTAIDHFVVAFNVKSYAGVEFIYPQDFLPCTTAASGFALPPGASVIVRAKWPGTLVPPAGSHACLLASVLSRSNHPQSSKHVWEQNSLAQKNLSIVDAHPDTWFVIPFVIDNRWMQARAQYTLELIRPRKLAKLQAELLYTGSLVAVERPGRKAESPLPEPDPRAVLKMLESRYRKANRTPPAGLICSATPKRLERILPDCAARLFPVGKIGRIPLTLLPGQQRLLGLKVHVPAGVRKGDVLALDLIKRAVASKKVLGGIAVALKIL